MRGITDVGRERLLAAVGKLLEINGCKYSFCNVFSGPRSCSFELRGSDRGERAWSRDQLAHERVHPIDIELALANPPRRARRSQRFGIDGLMVGSGRGQRYQDRWN